MKKTLLLLALLLLLPMGGEAKRGKRETVVVRDYTSAAWDGVVAQTVEDFNAVLPKRVRLRYERHEETACEALPAPKPRDTFLAFCSVPFFDREREFAALPYRKGVLAFSDRYAVDRHVAFRATYTCHELMHVLTGVGDNIGALPEESCVWGYLAQPGPFDVDLLRKTYKRKHR